MDEGEERDETSVRKRVMDKVNEYLLSNKS